MERLLCIAALVAAFAQASFAADSRFPIPAGWTANPLFHAAAGDGVAVGLISKTPANSTNRVLQYRAGEATLTDFPDKVTGLTYSPDGELLLVQSVVLDGTNHGSPATSLVDASGTILWTKSDIRAFFFSSTGAVVFAWQASDIWGTSPEMELFALSGDSLRVIAVGGRPIGAAMVFGAGEQVAIGVAGSLLGKQFAGSTMTSSWQVHLGADDPGIERLEVINGSRFLMHQGYGHFKVISTSGVVEYSYNPMNLAAADPSRSTRDYAHFEPAVGATTDQLLLFDGTKKGFVLDIATGVLSEKQLDLSTPAGFTLRPSIRANKFVLIGPNEIRIRNL